MTSHEKRINALIRLHGLTKAAAEKRARAIEASPTRNPTKRKTAARTQRAAESYVRRPSQVTKKAPSPRLKKRRTINLQSPRGVFPNPKTRDNEIKVQSQIAMSHSSSPKKWATVAKFPATPEGAENAIMYAKAYAKMHNKYAIRVIE